ncbi:hypothetical protein JRQ81_011959 [Phrynocephalus forsythii]|uniref:CLOCK-interacting pacemaker n=1 Tax=Phrynocephalus forsythii TaxID=171643 RepID=A0A9Q0X6U3_9SAUR|nr:hypothetical protein JRQ81_011959 [Phrynocephalus forsythii]
MDPGGGGGKEVRLSSSWPLPLAAEVPPPPPPPPPAGSQGLLRPALFSFSLQPLGTSQATQFLAWGSQHPLNGAQGSPARVLFIQPPVASLKPLLPGRKLPSRDTYLPILSTYPKIAPHPGPDRQAKGAAEGGPLLAGGTSKNKRFCLEEAWVSSSEPAAPRNRDSGDKQSSGEVPALPPPLPSGRPPPQLLGTEPLSQNAVTSSGSRLEQAEGRMLSRASKKLSSSSLGKQRRFHNTVEILRKSGLLGITLRTKELLRQNGSTQRELSEVREHARLFCEAVQSNDGQAWARLQQAMSRSSAYWAARGAKDPLGHLAGMPNRAGELDGPVPEDAAGKSPPCSPMNLSLAPDTSVQVAMP